MIEKLTILQRMALNEEHASEACLNRYSVVVRGMVRAWFSQKQDIDDLVQDVFISIWRSAHRFDPEIASEMAFVKTITRRQMINRLRRNDRDRDVPLNDEVDVHVEYLLSMERRLEADRIEAIMNELRPEQRKVMVLFYKWGMTHAEISEATAIALGTIKSHIRRGLQTLRQCLAAQSGSVPLRA